MASVQEFKASLNNRARDRLKTKNKQKAKKGKKKVIYSLRATLTFSARVSSRKTIRAPFPSQVKPKAPKQGQKPQPSRGGVSGGHLVCMHALTLPSS